MQIDLYAPRRPDHGPLPRRALMTVAIARPTHLPEDDLKVQAVNAPHPVALVRAGAVFHKGKLLERPAAITPEPSRAEAETVGSEVA